MQPRLLGYAAVAAWSALGAGGAAAQGIPAQPERYLLTTNVTDGRAAWVNPAALARRLEASLGADLSLDRFSGGTAVSQYGASFASRGLALGWSHDRFGGEGSANSYVIGVGVGTEGFSAGAARRWYRGPSPAPFPAPDSLSGPPTNVRWAYWDVAIRTVASGWLQLSAVGRNLGAAAPHDSASAPLVVPAVSASLLGGLLDAAAECDLVASGWHARAWRLGATVALSSRLLLVARADLTADLTATGFALALQFEGARSRASGFTSLSRGAGAIQAGGIAAALVARRPGIP